MCDFCSNEVFTKQGIYENDVIRVLYPLSPVVFGHLMIMPKRHMTFFTDLTDEELSEIKKFFSIAFSAFNVNRRADGFNIVNNNGESAGQHIPHTHIHVFMRKYGDVSPFDILSKRKPREKLSQKKWDDRRSEIQRWFV